MSCPAYFTGAKPSSPPSEEMPPFATTAVTLSGKSAKSKSVTA
jgi:hypothetical protein